MERFCHGERRAQIRSVVWSGEVRIAHQSDPIPAIEYRGVLRVNTGLVVEQEGTIGRPGDDRVHHVGNSAVDDAASAAAQEMKLVPTIALDSQMPIGVFRIQ